MGNNPRIIALLLVKNKIAQTIINNDNDITITAVEILTITIIQILTCHDVGS